MRNLASEDYLQNFKYSVTVASPSWWMPYITSMSSMEHDGGFNSINIPKLNIPKVRYREGAWGSCVVHILSGVPDWDVATFSRGIILKDTFFYDFAMGSALHQNGMRADLLVAHMQPTVGFKTYGMIDCSVSGFQPTSELSGTDNDISISSIDIKFEWLEIGIVES